MAWTVDYTETARKQLRKLDKQVARRILDFLDERVAAAEARRAEKRLYRAFRRMRACGG